MIDRQEEPSRGRIVVSEGRVQQLARIFDKTRQRRPTSEELRGLVEAYIKEEVYCREALKLGLDRDDTLIRRCMKQKMEFLTELPEGTLQATEADLEAYLADNRPDFRVEPGSPSSRFSSRSTGRRRLRRRAQQRY